MTGQPRGSAPDRTVASVLERTGLRERARELMRLRDAHSPELAEAFRLRAPDAMRRDPREALALVRLALLVARTVGAAEGIAAVLRSLAQAAILSGRYPTALRAIKAAARRPASPLGRAELEAIRVQALTHLERYEEARETAEPLVEVFRDAADRKGEITEEGIRAIVEAEGLGDAGLVHLVSIHVSGGSEETPVAVVRITQDGEEREFSADGDGMVNAAFVALQDAFNVPAALVDYRVSPITAGADAMAEVSVIIQVGSTTFAGRGVSTDVVEGSARAFVAALNKTIVDASGDVLDSPAEE